MSNETSATIQKRLPASLQRSLANNASTPLQHWLNANCHDSVALMRFASTFPKDISFSLILAAASATLLDAAKEHRPVRLSYAVPLWRSITEGQVSVQYLNNVAAGIFDNDAPSPVSTIEHLDEHVAAGLARTSALDGPARRHLMKQALKSDDMVHAALAWYSFDLETAAQKNEDDISKRFPMHWAHTYPEDPDTPLAMLRAYLQAARKIGVVGALTPLEQEATSTLSVADAAWLVAWDEAARANAHSICADLALRRASRLEPQSAHQHRWLLIYGFHEEHKPARHAEELPIDRRLLDMMYHIDTPYIPASLCVSIAAKTDQLEPVLREALPYLKGPTIPLLKAAFGVGDAPVSLGPLADINTAGALLALRIQRERERHQVAGIEAPISRRTPAPVSILDNFETNEELLSGTFAFEEETTTSQPEAPAEATSDNEAPAEELHPDRGEQFIRWSEEWDEDLKTEQFSPEYRRHSNNDEHPSTRPTATEDDYESELVSTPPTELDIFLAAALPDDLRRRADRLLTRRLANSNTYDRELLSALDTNIALLPESSWLIAQTLLKQGEHGASVAWMERVASATTSRHSRAARYKALGRCWLNQLQEPAQALEYLVVSYSCLPTDGETIELLDRCYTKLHKESELIAAYRSALRAADAHPVDKALRTRWEARLQELQKRESGV